MIIGLSGYARSGKDTAAEVLVDEYGFTRIAFADKLRECLYALNPILETSLEVSTGLFGDGQVYKRTRYLQDVINAVGWGEYKKGPYAEEIRRLLQRLGTEAGRHILGEDVWVNAALDGSPERVVVADTRFVNEAKAIKHRGGEIWRIIREGTGPINDHISETGLDDWAFDGQIDNNGRDLELFKQSVRGMANACGL